MTVKDFYKAHKEDEIIEFTTPSCACSINNPFFTSWRKLFNIVDSNIKIQHFSLEFGYDGCFNGFVFYVSKEDYEKIKEKYNKNT